MSKSNKLPTRGIKSILKAENELTDRVWYERKLVLLQKLKSGEETIDPKIKKGMLASMKRAEAKYGGKRTLLNYHKNAFDWGMTNGKLSALRWVLGEDWDELYT